MNTEKLYGLISAYRHDEDAVNLIQETMEDFVRYVEICVRQGVFQNTNKGVTEENEYRSEFENIDRRRSVLHNKCISSIGVLNRLSEEKGLVLFYEGVASKDAPHRRSIGDAIGLLVKELYDSRK